MSPSSQVDSAIAAVRNQFPGHTCQVEPDGRGGVFLTIDDIAVGKQYDPATTWLGFQVNAAYPHSDVYPHYIGPVRRLDGRAHGPGVQSVTWRGRPALQLSRRSNHWNPTLDNAALKATKVLRWFADQ